MSIRYTWKCCTWETVYKRLKEGFKAKLPEWEGYWAWENNTIMMHCKDGKTLDIRETDDVAFTFGNIARKDWVCWKEVEEDQ